MKGMNIETSKELWRSFAETAKLSDNNLKIEINFDEFGDEEWLALIESQPFSRIIHSQLIQQVNRKIPSQ